MDVRGSCKRIPVVVVAHLSPLRRSKQKSGVDFVGSAIFGVRSTLPLVNLEAFTTDLESTMLTNTFLMCRSRILTGNWRILTSGMRASTDNINIDCSRCCVVVV